MAPVRVRDLRPADAAAAAAIHFRYLPEQFLSHAGPRFLTRYQQAFQAPHGLALVAEGPDGQVVGVLLGSTDAARFYAGLPARDGKALSVALARAAITRPRFGVRLARTRAPRYLRWLRRRLTGRGAPETASTPAQTVGEVTVVVVDPGARGLGAGRALIDEAARRTRAAGTPAVELVTGPEDPAARFYEHLGWTPLEEVASASGERFRKYRLELS